MSNALEAKETTMRQLRAHYALCAAQVALMDSAVDAESIYYLSMKLRTIQESFAMDCIEARQ